MCSGGPLGIGHWRPRYTTGPFAASYGKTGRRMSWRTYQSVLSNDVQSTSTSLRTPSTSCAYQSGKVSLSPAVMRMPYGSTESSRSWANAKVSVCPARDAAFQFVNSGTNANARIHELASQDVLRGISTTSRPTLTSSLPNSDATP